MTDSKLPLDERINPKPQEGTWTLVAPDGRQWQAESPMRCIVSEQNERIPASVQLANIRAALRAQSEAQPVAEIHFPQWGEPIVAWHGHTLDKPCNVTVYGRPAPPLRAPEDARALDEVLRDAFEWQMVTFPHASPQSAANHLLAEAKELKDDPTDAGEMADVMLLLSSVARQQGIDLAKAVRDKMAINRARKWGKVNEEGYVEHVRDAAISGGKHE